MKNFINLELQIESKDDLTPLENLFKGKLKCLNKQEYDNTYYLYYSLKRHHKSVETAFEAYMKVLYDPILMAQLGTLWYSSEKIFNIELMGSACNDPTFDIKVNKEILERLSILQVEISIILHSSGW